MQPQEAAVSSCGRGQAREVRWFSLVAEAVAGRRPQGATLVVTFNKLALSRTRALVMATFHGVGRGDLSPGRQARALHFTERFVKVLATVLKGSWGDSVPLPSWEESKGL